MNICGTYQVSDPLQYYWCSSDYCHLRFIRALIYLLAV